MPTIIDLNINKNNFVDPSNYYNSINTIKQQLPSILDDFKKYYVFYNNVPDYPEYQTMYENIKNNINNLNSQLFTITNNVDSSIEEINTSLTTLNTLINKEKSKKNKLQTKQDDLIEQNNSTHEMIQNYDQIYELEYLKNWGLFGSLLFSLYIISIVFKKQNVTTTNYRL
jgi:hypothetical protein